MQSDEYENMDLSELDDRLDPLRLQMFMRFSMMVNLTMAHTLNHIVILTTN